MAPDRGHFHHRLLDMGLSQKQAVAILYAISAVLGLAAVLITTSGAMKAIVLVLAFFVAIMIGFAVMQAHPHHAVTGQAEEKPAEEDEPQTDEKQD